MTKQTANALLMAAALTVGAAQAATIEAAISPNAIVVRADG